jgi:hypothetical protein
VLVVVVCSVSKGVCSVSEGVCSVSRAEWDVSKCERRTVVHLAFLPNLQIQMIHIHPLRQAQGAAVAARKRLAMINA